MSWTAHKRRYNQHLESSGGIFQIWIRQIETWLVEPFVVCEQEEIDYHEKPMLLKHRERARRRSIRDNFWPMLGQFKGRL